METFLNHRGYSRTYKENKLTLGLVFPLEAYKDNVPLMNLDQQVMRAKAAECGQFAALYVRDVPLNDPSFGDAGQMYDPWIFLSYIAAHTNRIALGTASVITSFQHPLHLAKSATSMDNITRERFLLGLATGDRTVEFDVFGVNRDERATLYQEALYVMKQTWANSFPTIETSSVHLDGTTDMLPKPRLSDIPTFVTGFSGQTLEWIAEQGDGWISYARPTILQQKFINDYRTLTNSFKPFSQSLHIDVAEDSSESPTYMQLGFRSGRRFLIDHLHELQEIGVNHVILNFKGAKRPVDEIIQELAEEVVPYFPALT